MCQRLHNGIVPSDMGFSSLLPLKQTGDKLKLEADSSETRGGQRSKKTKVVEAGTLLSAKFTNSFAPKP